MLESFSEADSRGELGLIPLSSCSEFGRKIDEHIKENRRRAGLYYPETFIIPIEEIRFANGEGKTRLPESVRGRDIYILCDVGNYSCTYDLYGYTNHKGPDEHFQDIKRALSAICGKSRRTTVVMPMLYASRQDKRKGRESLDCALALKELESLGVKDIISFDLHDSRVQNAVPLSSFENLYATYEIVRTFMDDEKEIVLENENLLVISPDSGGMDRAIYYSGVLKTDVGLFYKRRDLTKIVNGKNPIIQHEYMGQPIEGKNIMIIDDMIASGESILEIAVELKKRNANKIFVATTFALFTEGCEKFESFYEQGIIDRVYTTNLTYVPKEIKQMQWFKEVDMSECLARFIDQLNHNRSIAPLIDATTSLRVYIEDLRRGSAMTQ